MKIFDTVKSALLDGIIELDVWACISTVQKYEEKYGVAHTPLSDPCKVANMVEELLYRIYGDLDEARRLPAEELEDMRLEAIRWFEKHPDGLLDIWESWLTRLVKAVFKLTVRR